MLLSHSLVEQLFRGLVSEPLEAGGSRELRLDAEPLRLLLLLAKELGHELLGREPDLLGDGSDLLLLLLGGPLDSLKLLDEPPLFILIFLELGQLRLFVSSELLLE